MLDKIKRSPFLNTRMPLKTQPHPSTQRSREQHYGSHEYYRGSQDFHTKSNSPLKLDSSSMPSKGNSHLKQGSPVFSPKNNFYMKQETKGFRTKSNFQLKQDSPSFYSDANSSKPSFKLTVPSPTQPRNPNSTNSKYKSKGKVTNKRRQRRNSISVPAVETVAAPVYQNLADGHLSDISHDDPRTFRHFPSSPLPPPRQTSYVYNQDISLRRDLDSSSFLLNALIEGGPNSGEDLSKPFAKLSIYPSKFPIIDLSPKHKPIEQDLDMASHLLMGLLQPAPAPFSKPDTVASNPNLLYAGPTFRRAPDAKALPKPF